MWSGVYKSGKEFSGTPHAALHFIKQQHDAVLIAEFIVSVFAPESMAEVFSELYIRACMLIFISFVSLYAFIPDAKYRERTPASDPFKAAAKSKSTAAVDELMKYKGQLDRGEITREEFEKKKSELMK